jgi:hypothetical protein
VTGAAGPTLGYAVYPSRRAGRVLDFNCRWLNERLTQMVNRGPRVRVP